MAVGIVTANVRNEADPAYALLHDSVNKDSPTVRIGAILGLGIAYAGTAKEDIYSLLSPIVEDAGIQLDIACFAAITIGLVFVGTCHEHAVESILTVRWLCIVLLPFLARKHFLRNRGSAGIHDAWRLGQAPGQVDDIGIGPPFPGQSNTGRGHNGSGPNRR